MKKLVIWALACIWGIPAWAEGYQVNVLSAKQTGMGHVGTAMKLGAESMHFNPAGLVFLKEHMDFRSWTCPSGFPASGQKRNILTTVTLPGPTIRSVRLCTLMPVTRFMTTWLPASA